MQPIRELLSARAGRIAFRVGRDLLGRVREPWLLAAVSAALLLGIGFVSLRTNELPQLTASANVEPPPPADTPTPTPDPNVWRFEGRIVDAQGRAIEGVCVVIGPSGCRPFSPHTDPRGVYSFEVPKNPTVIYDLTFEKEGYVTVSHRAQPAGPTIFNVILAKRK